MSQRLKSLSANFVADPIDFLNIWAILTQKQKTVVEKVKAFAHQHLITDKFHQCIEKAQFPEYLIEQAKKLDVMKYFIDEPYGEHFSLLGQCFIIETLAEYDLSFSTFFFLIGPLSAKTIEKLGSEEQKQKYLPDLIGLNKIWGWALTQRNVGSNASQIQSEITKTTTNYELNGNKRWIGNGNRDYLIVYAKEKDAKTNIRGFIVDMKSKGVKSTKIQNKLALRSVANCQIQFTSVQIPFENYLPKASNYKAGVEAMLKHSRVFIIWNAVGGCVGVYKHVAKYAAERRQFGKSISGHQLVQEKIVKIMSNLQAILLAAWRITQLSEQGKATIGMIGMMKAWVTEKGRLICSLGRQILGGNGITHSNLVMKALCDMEAVYTYEGTYDINILVAASEITGVRAFK